MIPVAEALARTLALARPVEVEEIPLAEAYGRVLAGPAVARLTQPPFDAASMDGYALRRADTFPGLDDAWVRIAVRRPDTTRKLLAALRVEL